MSVWLSVVGIGEDGIEGLSAAARALVEGAEVLVGGERHLALVPAGAAEAKAALAQNTLGLPFIALAGRRGGSALAAAAVNALAQEESP